MIGKMMIGLAVTAIVVAASTVNVAAASSQSGEDGKSKDYGQSREDGKSRDYGQWEYGKSRDPGKAYGGGGPEYCETWEPVLTDDGEHMCNPGIGRCAYYCADPD
jgi:hypothetical protein